MKKWLLIALLFPSIAFAQNGGALVSGIVVLGSTGRPVAGAQVTICQLTDNGVPCTQTVNIYSDPLLTVPMANPTTTDGNGNVFAFAQPGSYHYTVTGQGVSPVGQPYSATVAGTGSGNVTTAGNNVMTGNNTFTGLNTASCFSTLMNVAYIGGSCAVAWGNGDIGAQFNAAYAALPIQGGTIKLIPQSTGACYLDSTPMVAATVSKFLNFEGTGADAQSDPASPPTIAGGSCISWTPTTGTMLTLDYVPILGGAFSKNHGIRGITFIRGQCNAGVGGSCPSNTATGITLGGTNSGTQNSSWDRVGVDGFHVGVLFTSTGSTSWGTSIDHSSIKYNDTGLSIGGGIENLNITSSVIASNNQYGINLTGTSTDINVRGGSIDSNGTCGVISSGGTMYFDSVHWENLGSNNACYVNGGLTAHIHLGQATDDCVSSAACGSVTPSYWFTAPILTAEGMDIVSAGRDTNPVFLPTSGGTISVTAGLGIIPGHIVPTVTGNSVYIRNGGAGNAATIESVFFIADGGPAMSCTNVAFTGWGGGAACSLPEGGSQKFSFAITAGTSPSANPTITITYPHVWPVAPLMQCKVIGGSGAPAFITGEEVSISTTTLGPLTYNGTPVNTLGYQISCQGM